MILDMRMCLSMSSNSSLTHTTISLIDKVDFINTSEIWDFNFSIKSSKNKADSRSNHKLRPSYQSHPNIISTFSNSTMLYLVIMLFVLIYLSNFYFQCFLQFIVLLFGWFLDFGEIQYYHFIEDIYVIMLKIDTVRC